MPHASYSISNWQKHVIFFMKPCVIEKWRPRFVAKASQAGFLVLIVSKGLWCLLWGFMSSGMGICVGCCDKLLIKCLPKHSFSLARESHLHQSIHLLHLADSCAASVITLRSMMQSAVVVVHHFYGWECLQAFFSVLCFLSISVISSFDIIHHLWWWVFYSGNIMLFKSFSCVRFCLPFHYPLFF